jgi:ornithine carbamoyltransferase
MARRDLQTTIASPAARSLLMTAVASDKMTMPAHVFRSSDLDEDQFAHVLRTAERMKRDPHGWTQALPGRTLVTLFEKPSTRTCASLAAAAQRLGMLPLDLSGNELQLGRDERIEDTARVLSGYCSAIAVRMVAQSRLEQLAAAATVPVINAVSDDHHPCQALADLLTLHEQFGRLEGLRVAYVGEATNVAHSLLEAGARAGMSVAVATPTGYGPDPNVVAVARGLAVLHGGSIEITDDPDAAVRGAHAVYTDVWRDRRDLVPYQVTTQLMRAARADAVFMHCLPAHRGQEVSAEVIDGPQSIVFQQAANRMPTAQALVYALVRATEQ